MGNLVKILKLNKKNKIGLLVIFLISFVFIAERLLFIRIDTSYDPYSEYSISKKDERGILLEYEFINTINA